jgi:glycosyltransferase involved in cell wall biosynthesis
MARLFQLDFCRTQGLTRAVTNQTKLPISLAIITLNEEANIERCIRSVPFATEVVVVDSLSTDHTVEISKALGARVISQKFLGYRAQKQFAHDATLQPWVLSLDADECLSPELQAEILEIFRNPSDAGSGSSSPLPNGYRIPRLSFHLGRWIRHGGWYPDYQTRLYRRECAS